MNSSLQTARPTPDSNQSDAVIEAIVDTVAEAEGASPLELRPLAKAVDTDALTAVSGDGMKGATVEFRYCDYLVRVSGGDRIEVELSDDA